MARSAAALGGVGIVAVALALTASPALAAGELVVNGSFEEPPAPDNSYRLDASIPGWYLTRGPEFELARSIGAAYEGAQLLDLDSTASVTIAQDVPTVAGQTYRFRFAFSPRRGFGPDDNAARATWDGTVVASWQGDGTANNDTDWVPYDLVVTATGAQTTITFADASVNQDDSTGPLLDGVSVTEVAPDPVVPEAPVAALLPLAAAGVVAVWWRRRQDAPA